jgi:hypothetical protein
VLPLVPRRSRMAERTQHDCADIVGFGIKRSAGLDARRKSIIYIMNHFYLMLSRCSQPEVASGDPGQVFHG